MLYKKFLLLLSLFTTYHLNAQDYSWAVQAQSNNSGYSSEAIDIEVDDENNIYSAIKVYDSIWIESTHLKSKGGANIFIVKYDKNGKFLDTLAFSSSDHVFFGSMKLKKDKLVYKCFF